jgi:hypothetical protein
MTEHSDIDLTDSIGWLIENTSFPTFETFKKDPDKWRGHVTELFDSVDNSTQIFKKQLVKQRYMWMDQYKCDSLEHLETIVKNEGYNISELEMEPVAMPIHGTSTHNEIEIVIRFWPKEIMKLRGKVVAND